MRRRSFLATGAGILAMPAIGRSQPSARVLRFAPQADLALLDPVQTPAFVTRNHGCLVYDMLYGVDGNFRPQPQMVAGHVVDDDARRWTLTLRDGLRFHDGSPVLGRDVVASIRRWAAIDAFGQSLMAATDELSAPSDRQVVFRLKKPFLLLPEVLGKPASYIPAIMPERLAAGAGRSAVAEIVGSGPYRFLPDERVAGSRNVYSRFEGYVPREGAASFLAGGKQAHFDRVEWHTLPDPSTAAAALQSGEIDWWEQATADLVPLLRQHRDIRVEVLEDAGYIAVLRFNHVQPPFDNPAIRRALLSAIDQADFMTAVAGEDREMWQDGVGFFQPDSPMATKAGMAALTGPRDFAKARRDLQAAGYRGERVVLLSAADYPSINAMSEVAAEVCRKIGINLDYQVQDWGAVATRLNSKEPPEKGGWNLTCNIGTGHGARNPAAHSWLRGMGPSRPGWGWPTSPKIEELREAWLDATTEAEQKSLCEQIQIQAFEDLPYIPLGLFRFATAYRRSLVGVQKGLPLFWSVRRA